MAKPIAVLFALLVALIFSPAVKAQVSGDVAVVVNVGNPVSNLSLGELRRTFRGEKHSWPGGIPVKLIVRGPGCRERLTLMKLLQTSESEYKQYWTAQVLRGEATSEPDVIPSVGMQREAIRIFLGGITLVDAYDVKPGMKVIRLDGHLPGEPGYPLH